MTPDTASNDYHDTVLRRWGWVTRLRPLVLAELILRLFVPGDRRRVFVSRDGLKLFLDPLSHAGRTIVRDGTLEQETDAFLRRFLEPGECFLDIGANEGVFTAIAARLVGEQGRVVAVEPQSRLASLVEVNVGLNGGKATVLRGAVGGESGGSAVLNLYPSLNTGASSIVTRYRFARATERVPFIGFEDVLNACRRGTVDLVKIDVEGFEGRVIRSMADGLRRRQFRRLLLDFHVPQLRALGDSPAAIDAYLSSLGMTRSEGDLDGGYAVYEHTESSRSGAQLEG